MTPERIAEIVADVMPIAGGGETGEALRLYVRAALRSTADAERDRVLYAVRDIAGLEIALKVQLATAQER